MSDVQAFNALFKSVSEDPGGTAERILELEAEVALLRAEQTEMAAVTARNLGHWQMTEASHLQLQELLEQAMGEDLVKLAERCDELHAELASMCEEANAAEARAARLRTALQAILDTRDESFGEAFDIASAALAEKD